MTLSGCCAGLRPCCSRPGVQPLRPISSWYSSVALVAQTMTAASGERLHPVVHPLLQEMLGFVPPEPPQTVLDVIDAWTERYPTERYPR